MLARFLLALCVSAALIAQSVSPLHFATAEAPTNSPLPFGTTTVPKRYSQVHDDVPAMVIHGMSFRHSATTVVYPAHSITISAWISTASTTSATTSATFDNNHGVDRVQVVTNRTYALPASDPFNVPGQFILDYPFDTPFVFPGGASLCWEVHVTATTLQSGLIAYDLASAGAALAASPDLVVGRAGLGCMATGRTARMAATATQSINWSVPTGTRTVTGTNLAANGAVFFTTGLDKTVWNAIPLPALIPTSSGAPSGACTVYADILAATLVVANSTGTASLAATFAPSPAYHGMTLYSQIWGLDLPANPFGITTSNLVMHHIVAPFAVPLPVSSVFLTNSLGPIGTMSRNGLVTRFY